MVRFPSTLDAWKGSQGQQLLWRLTVMLVSIDCLACPVKTVLESQPLRGLKVSVLSHPIRVFRRVNAPITSI